MPSSSTTLLSLLGGVLPALLWLWFWLREDSKRPEPRFRIVSAFLLGMLAVLVVLPIEKIIYDWFGPSLRIETLTAWATAEELVKFGAAYIAALRFSDTDEPIDFLVYMVSTALGFSALENSFFLANLVGDGLFTQSIISGNMRFLGATLLHVISSATLGTFLALSFYKAKEIKNLSIAAGVIFSICLHTLFNFFIINLGERVFYVFGVVWFFIIILILLFEKVKSVEPASSG